MSRSASGHQARVGYAAAAASILAASLLTGCSASVSVGQPSTTAATTGATTWTTAQQAQAGLTAAGIPCAASASSSPSVVTPDPSATSGLGYVQVMCEGFYVAIITDAALAKESDKQYFCGGGLTQAELDKTVSVVGTGFSISGNEGGNYGTWPTALPPSAFTQALPGTSTETDAVYKSRIC